MRRWRVGAAAAASVAAHGIVLAILVRGRVPARPAPPRDAVAFELADAPAVAASAGDSPAAAPTPRPRQRRTHPAPRSQASGSAAPPSSSGEEVAAPSTGPGLLGMRFGEGTDAGASPPSLGRLAPRMPDDETPPAPPPAFDFGAQLPPEPPAHTAREEFRRWLRDWRANPGEESAGRTIRGHDGVQTVDLTAIVLLLRALADADASGPRTPRAPAAREPVRMDLALVELGAAVRRIWSDTARPPAQRRQLLFALWDECVESGDDEAAVGGRRARQLILLFIRRELPAGSPHAYTAAELTSLNAARTSRQPFRPY